MCFVIMYYNIFNPLPYRIVQAFVEQWLTISLCTSAPTSQTSLCLVFNEKKFSGFSNIHRYKARLFAASLGFSQLSSAFRYQASSKHAWPKNKSTAEKQTDSLILLAKRNWPFAFTKQNDMCCTLLPNVKNANSMYNF